MRHGSRRNRLLAVASVAALLGVACGGKPGASSTTAAIEGSASTSSVASGGSRDTEPAPPQQEGSSTSQATSTAPPAEASTAAPERAPEVLAPLTGLPTTEPLLARRPAVVVKIDGHLKARPQWGIDEADVVIEEIVEGITRFMAVFHSRIPESVGPIRSARTQDMLIAPMLDNPLFVWSGGNSKVSAIVRKGPVVSISATHGWRLKGIWYRTKKRRAPHNLLAHGEAVLAQAGEDARAPRPLFAYRSPIDEAGGRDVSGVRIVMSGTRVQWLWNSERKVWERTADGKPHLAESGNRVGAANVVVLEVKYRSSAADPNSPEAQTRGSGKALVFTGGRLVVGTWTRKSGPDPWTLLDKDGNPVLLTPGQTWVELSLAGKSSIIDVGVDPKDVRWKIA